MPAQLTYLCGLASSNHKDIGLAYVMSALLGGVIGTTLSAHFGMPVQLA